MYQTNPWNIYSYTVLYQAFFWLSVTEWLKSFFTTIDLLTSCNIMFGLFRKDMPLLNHSRLLGKQVIYQSRHLNIKPSLSLLKTKLKNAYTVRTRELVWIWIIFLSEQSNQHLFHTFAWISLLTWVFINCTTQSSKLI